MVTLQVMTYMGMPVIKMLSEIGLQMGKAKPPKTFMVITRAVIILPRKKSLINYLTHYHPLGVFPCRAVRKFLVAPLAPCEVVAPFGAVRLVKWFFQVV